MQFSHFTQIQAHLQHVNIQQELIFHHTQFKKTC